MLFFLMHLEYAYVGLITWPCIGTFVLTHALDFTHIWILGDLQIPRSMLVHPEDAQVQRGWMWHTIADDSSADAWTEYERQRLENVKRNQALIAALGIQHVKAEIQQQSASKKADHKGYKKSADKRAREREEPIVTRRLRSSRVSWTSEDAEKLGNPPSPEPVKDLFKVEDKRKSLNILSTCVRQSSTENFLERLRNFDDQVPLAQVCTFKRRKHEHGDIGPNDLSLHKTDIARVVPGRIMSVAFLPINDFLLVVAGDKFGHLGFWEVESRDEDGDGVNIFQPHSAPVSGVAVQPPGATKVLTCSYDGTVKRLDVEISMFDLMYSLDNDDIFFLQFALYREAPIVPMLQKVLEL
ncbi:hypothetical protein KP509_20G055800 [Ceratopteris richardii]|uniref:Uncharacterized protein n=1 Tax=Ceratopteris richardii TaxID=49495 RepID=A0A8T2SHB3_CERRI|nr:hypothetical protein KP509_20G055800 [Ceratopteris richardii]